MCSEPLFARPANFCMLLGRLCVDDSAVGKLLLVDLGAADGIVQLLTVLSHRADGGNGTAEHTTLAAT